VALTEPDSSSPLTSSLASILWLRWRIFLVNLGLRYVEWQIERKRRQGAMERRR
jgi:hypothetical protein